MPALTWLDSSSAARQQTMEIIKLFEEKGTIDEIGIGTVRDAISDILFPGTSTLHTRARYFLIIPWLYLHLESRKIPSTEIAKEARKLEISLIDKILASDDPEGAIGRVAKARLKILPSTMYWSGTQTWGLREFPGSKDQYHRSLTRFYHLRNGARHDDDRNPLDGVPAGNWHAGLPKPPPGFPKEPLPFTLTRAEAEYLRDRLMARCTGTLLAHLVDACDPALEAEFVWEHPEYSSFPARNQEQLLHARNFSEVIHGASILYNVLLAEARQHEEWTAEHRESFETWEELMLERADELRAWPRTGFWSFVLGQNPRISTGTQLFVNKWLDLTLQGNPRILLDDRRARQLIVDREHQIKGRLARFQNQAALGQWLGGSGLSQLSYRWNPEVRQVTADIQDGVRRDA